MSSCFQYFTGSAREYSQKYLLHPQIHFVGIYDKDGRIIGRFTIGIDDENKRIALLSRVYKRGMFDANKHVKDWLKEFSKNKEYKIGNIAVKDMDDFYDDVMDIYDISFDELKRLEDGSIIIPTIKIKGIKDVIEYAA